MLKDYILEVNEKLLSGGEVIFPSPQGGVSLLEALLLKTRGEVLSLLPFCKRREVRVGRKAYHVYRL